ncbi:histidine phosphotransferase family protein [Paracoccus sp. PAMC 22219]|uniref:histidine phosphotransferase family protein n=1 Tax=Paracoccus sp. PAMC 22219 TaxID=1569209 RepID=UPI0005AB4CD4|nr:histidine phosphotransferase family protein [Paracoccus sp. PAMC 22219]
MTVDTTRIAAGDLAALLGSRLCHDLVSPLGAIGNGVELLEMSPDFPGLAQSPELRLIAEAVGAARVRIQAYRMAFGMAQGEQRIGRAELARLLDGMVDQGRLKITLDAQGDFARPQIRMLILAVMCMESAMPWGGRLIVLRDGQQWRLVAECDRSKVDPGLWAWLDGPQPRALAPSEVHFALLAEASRAENRPLRHEFDGTGGEIAF